MFVAQSEEGGGMDFCLVVIKTAEAWMMVVLR